MRRSAIGFVAALVLAGCGGAQTYGSGTAELTGAGTIFLWCSTPGGTACEKAEETLGAAPQDTQDLPQWLLGPMVDEQDDCQDPGVAVVLFTVGKGLGLASGNWHDNMGSEVSREELGLTYVGGGCTNCCWDKSEPPVKVHAVERDGARVYLVRVWEVGQE